MLQAVARPSATIACDWRVSRPKRHGQRKLGRSEAGRARTPRMYRK